MEMLAPVVADALGYHPVTTTRLASQTAATFSRYAPGGHQQARENHDRLTAADCTPRWCPGLYALEAGTGLLIAYGSWPTHEDFGTFIQTADSITSPGTELAAIDWDAAIIALDADELPGSSGEKQMLRLAASIAGDVPVRLGDAFTRIDNRNTDLLIDALLHASGRRQFPSRGCAHNGTATGDSGLSPGALPPAVVPMWILHASGRRQF